MPQLVRFMLLHAAVGFGVAALLVAALLLADPGGVGRLLLREGPFPAALLWFFLGLTYGGAQMGAALMLLGGPGGDRPSRASRAPARGAVLAFAHAGARGRRRR